MKQRAVVKYMNIDRGFGFLAPVDGSADIFFSIRAVHDNTKLTKGDKVLFVPGVDRIGRPRCNSVELVNDTGKVFGRGST
jgi:cold shock CspA family protein